MKLSAVLIVKNEEASLQRCLDSIAGADEIIICDTGSTDRTVEIARKNTHKVFTDFTWNENFSDARNHAKNKAAGDWILSIDADEVLLTGIDKVKETIKNANGSDSLNVIMSDGGPLKFNYPRIFKNIPNINWKGAGHEHPTVSASMQSDIEIRYGYSKAHKSDPDRMLRILKKAVTDGFMIKGNPLPRDVFYLGREYTYKNEWENAEYWLRYYLDIATWIPEKAEALYLLSICYGPAHLNRLALSKEMCLQAIGLNPNFKAAFIRLYELTGDQQWQKLSASADNRNTLFARSIHPGNIKYIITGTPRSATGYISKLLTAAGVKCGHESVYGFHPTLYKMPDAVAESSWLAAPELGSFQGKIIHIVRNPLDVIASMINRKHLDCLGDRYQNFIETHLPNINLYEGMDRYLYFWIHWNMMVEKHASVRLKVEDISMDTSILNGLFGSDISRSDFNNKKYNTDGRTNTVILSDLKNCLLYDLLKETAARYGYFLQ